MLPVERKWHEAHSRDSNAAAFPAVDCMSAVDAIKFRPVQSNFVELGSM